MSQDKKGRKTQPFYPVEVKRMAVGRLAAGERASAIAAELGCGPGRIYAWREEWQAHGGDWPGPGHRSRRSLPLVGSADRQAALERLVGQQQAELDFFREALRLIEQVRRPTAERGAPSPGSSSRAGRLNRKAG
jgi:transposase-like protein